MATVDPLRYRTNGDDPEIDPDLLAQVMDTLTVQVENRLGGTRGRRMAREGALRAARRDLQRRAAGDLTDVIYMGDDLDFEQRLKDLERSENNPISVTIENLLTEGGSPRGTRATARYPERVEGLGEARPPMMRMYPREAGRLGDPSLSEEDALNEQKRQDVARNVVEALLEMQAEGYTTFNGKVVPKTPVRERLEERFGGEDYIPVVDSVMSEVQGGEGYIYDMPATRGEMMPEEEAEFQEWLLTQGHKRRLTPDQLNRRRQQMLEQIQRGRGIAGLRRR